MAWRRGSKPVPIDKYRDEGDTATSRAASARRRNVIEKYGLYRDGKFSIDKKKSDKKQGVCNFFIQ